METSEEKWQKAEEENKKLKNKIIDFEEEVFSLKMQRKQLTEKIEALENHKQERNSLMIRSGPLYDFEEKNEKKGIN